MTGGAEAAAGCFAGSMLRNVVAALWVASRGEDIVPLVGARRRDRLAEALGAAEATLTPEDLAAIEAAVPAGAAAGERYPLAQMGLLDSER